ncbi:AzlC family ABC transporter permease, partial [Streptococcus suis]
KKIGLILLAVGLAYIGLSMMVSSYVAVLLATLLGCFVGVMIDDKN